jgi:hypothetical protein
MILCLYVYSRHLSAAPTSYLPVDFSIAAGRASVSSSISSNMMDWKLRRGVVMLSNREVPSPDLSPTYVDTAQQVCRHFCWPLLCQFCSDLECWANHWLEFACHIKHSLSMHRAVEFCSASVPSDLSGSNNFAQLIAFPSPLISFQDA